MSQLLARLRQERAELDALLEEGRERRTLLAVACPAAEGRPRPALPPPPTPVPAEPEIPLDPTEALSLLRTQLLAVERALAQELRNLRRLRTRTEAPGGVRCGAT